MIHDDAMFDERDVESYTYCDSCGRNLLASRRSYRRRFRSPYVVSELCSACCERHADLIAQHEQEYIDGDD